MLSPLHHAGSISELMEPAIEGPPSPESIRAISNQMRLASNSVSTISSEKNISRQSHQTTSSGSSSLRSITSSAERPSWDRDIATMEGSTSTSASTSSLSRKSSGRSTVSTQPRDSVQIFGKSIFGKRIRARRESSAQSSSSSVYSAEGLVSPTSVPAPPPVPVEVSTFMAPSAPFITPASYARSPPPTSNSNRGLSLGMGMSITSPKDAFMPFFNRRRANTRSNETINEEAAEGQAQKKLTISGPFNFQHLTSPKDEPLNYRASFVVTDSETSSIQSSQPSVENNSYFPNFSSETLAIGDDAVLATVPRRSPMRPHAASVSSGFPTQRSLLHSQSTDQLRTAPPPRPPRSPIEPSHSTFSPPIPPPRLSSRTSLQPGDLGTVSRTVDCRPRTSGSFRHPSPFSFSTPNVPRASGMHSHSHSYSADLGMGPVDTRRFSQMPDLSALSITSMPSPPTSAHDDSNWPLSSPGSAAATTPSLSSATNATFEILPGVPEEEEQTFNPRSSTHRSRMSIASNASSLRKSHSLPLLQQFPSPPPTSPQAATVRPPSAASDTLGTDVYAAQRTMRDLIKGTGHEHESDADAYLETSWEDDIDYCYEHEIEADCEYAWDRPSLDMSRDEVLAGMQNETPGFVPQLLSPASYDMPALSPASHASTASMSEAITPTTGVAGFATRRNPGLTIKTGTSEDRPVNKFLHARSSSRGSRASLFVEAQGFDLSPSLFIPGSDKYDCFRPPARGPVGFALGGDDNENDTENEAENDDDLIPSYLDPVTIMGMDKSMLYIPTRTSASTTGSGESRDSVLSSHISATSTATDLTRLTMSTISTSSAEDLAYSSKNANRESMIIPQF
ncbi:pak-box p21-rho-binding protein [Ophiostoma piceae UAMH 11346]|uniref:Pak-box p21-rho-binding protein n=1 Tax=Ophiostoma piceae (strain UAMH 11346) TaxID=1262450 RepID=S3C5Z1_OPHP1|nr:pak-box p21-rho-binding protein [Ophiostoma piceae UAMH 11346]